MTDAPKLWQPEWTGERYELAGRGPVYVVKSDRRFDKTDPQAGPLGWTVEIDGQTWRVKGFESYALEHISVGHPLGLLVEPAPAVME